MTPNTLVHSVNQSDIVLLAEELHCDTSLVISVLADATNNPSSTASILENTKSRLIYMLDLLGPDDDTLTGPEPHADYAEPEPEAESGADVY